MAGLNVAGEADVDCLLFMWSDGPHLDEAVSLGKSWGFRWATVAFIWNKETTAPGPYTEGQCEFVLVFKRGKIPVPRGARNVRQLVTHRTDGSGKPVEVRERIERMFPGQPKLDLVSAEAAPGWNYSTTASFPAQRPQPV